MNEIRLNVGSFWENTSNIETNVNSINWNIEHHKNKKIIIDLPISYFDSNIFNGILDLSAIEFESKAGHRYKPNDILIINNKLKDMVNDIKNSQLSPFEKFTSIYSFVTNYKPYKPGDDRYLDIGRSPYLFLNDDYINCVGICQFLCILCRQIGINITMLADEENEHAVCYFYILDDKYGIDGYFRSDPTNDTKGEIDRENKYINMIRRITSNNDFEKFLNSDNELSYPKDIIDINLFSKYVSFLKTSNNYVNNNQNSIDIIHSFRSEYREKHNHIGHDIIYAVILKVANLRYIPALNDKLNLKDMLFIEELKDKILAGESTNDIVESFVASSTCKKGKH